MRNAAEALAPRSSPGIRHIAAQVPEERKIVQENRSRENTRGGTHLVSIPATGTTPTRHTTMEALE